MKDFNRVSFDAPVQTEPGYSGSPIVDHAGRIVSLVTSFIPVIQKSKIAARSRLRGEEKERIGIPFAAPHPRDVVGWLHNVL